MKTKPNFGSLVTDDGEPRIPRMPIPGPRRPLESLGAKKTDKDAQDLEERNTDVSSAIRGILTDVVPSQHLEMAVEDFQKKFPQVTDIKQVNGNEFFAWVDTLPLATAITGVRLA